MFLATINYILYSLINISAISASKEVRKLKLFNQSRCYAMIIYQKYFIAESTRNEIAIVIQLYKRQEKKAKEQE